MRINLRYLLWVDILLNLAMVLQVLNIQSLLSLLLLLHAFFLLSDLYLHQLSVLQIYSSWAILILLIDYLNGLSATLLLFLLNSSSFVRLIILQGNVTFVWMPLDVPVIIGFSYLEPQLLQKGFAYNLLAVIRIYFIVILCVDHDYSMEYLYFRLIIQLRASFSLVA